MISNIRAFACAGAVLACAGGITAADAAMTVNFFSVQSNGRDFGGSQPDQTISNGVQMTLGPNGLPVLNTASTLGAVDIDQATGELLWWTPGSGTLNVAATGTQTIASNSFTDTSFFAPNGTGTNNDSAFLTAVFSGQFNLATAQTISFSLGSDDDSFLFVNGRSVGQVGGIHANQVRTFSTDLAAGNHVFQLFYADRRRTQASLSFALPEGLQVSPIPEPATWAMMLAGFGLAGSAMRRRNRSLTFA